MKKARKKKAQNLKVKRSQIQKPMKKNQTTVVRMTVVLTTAETTMVDRMTQVEMTAVVQMTQEMLEAMIARVETTVPTPAQKPRPKLK